jgi:uncharacterized protein (TIGR02246 family)
MWRIIFILTLIAPPALAAQAPGSEADEAAVTSLIQRYVDARDARDPSAVGALFTDDADQYTTTGAWRRGRAEVVVGTAESTKQNPGDRGIDVASVRFITPDVAIADGHYNIAGSDVRRWTTIVLKRETVGWRIAAIRNMAPTGGPNGGTR